MGYIKEPKGVDFIFRRRWCSLPTAFGQHQQLCTSFPATAEIS